MATIANHSAGLDVQIQTRIRIFPYSDYLPKEPVHTSVSIIDSTVAGFTPTGGVWIFSQPLDTDTLVLSLKRTLSSYPQWAGQLHFATFDPALGHTNRQGRVVVSYGTSTDPGVEFVVAHSPRRIATLIPEPINGYWDVGSGQLRTNELIDTGTSLALHNMSDCEGLPSMIIQVTTFDCGSVSIGIKSVHSLADAQTLLQFVRDWAAVNRALVSNTPVPSLQPVFEPKLLDRAAAGDIDAGIPDPALIDISRALPLHRYDYWASATNSPPFMTRATQIPSCLDTSTIEPMGTPLPWSQWDFTTPVSHYMIYFSHKEVEGIYQNASSLGRVSHLDTLLAHIWALIIRAIQLKPDEEHCLDMTLGLRTRLSPALPETFLGSPITLAKVRATSDSPLAEMALSIRGAVAQFNPSTLPALLHDVAHQSGAQRYWNAFLGRRNVIVTSWLKLGVHDMDFDGRGERPTYFEAIMPNLDGCVQVMEAGHIHGVLKSGRGDWYADGVSVSLHLATAVAQRLLEDPLLRKYA